MEINYSLYLVTDERYDNLLDRVENALHKGVTLVQYRAKHKSTEEQIAEAKALKVLCDKFKVPLIINDNLQVALAVDAAGVHLGQDDTNCLVARNILGKNKIVGVSVHNLLETELAVQQGADYLGIGAVFPTGTKTDVDVVGLKGLSEICATVNIPVVAIGGVNFNNYKQAIAVGARGVAMVTGLLGDWK